MRNAEDIVRRCITCQKFASRPHAPASELKTILLSWPFATWGLDMVGSLKKSSKGGRTHLLVAVDKFTKWIEAVPITSSTAFMAVNFIKSIIFRFGYHITSSRTMERTSQRQNSKTFAKNWASKSTMRQSHTRSPTARWKRQMV